MIFDSGRLGDEGGGFSDAVTDIKLEILKKYLTEASNGGKKPLRRH